MRYLPSKGTTKLRQMKVVEGDLRQGKGKEGRKKWINLINKKGVSEWTTYLVGGMISTTSKKNTWRLIKIEIDNVTWEEMKIRAAWRQHGGI